MTEKRPSLLIFDFDGCLYPYPDDFMDVYNAARTKTGIAMSGGAMDNDTAFQRCMESYLEHGFTFKSLCDEFGLSMGEGSMIHHRYVNFQLAPDPDLIDSMRALDRKNVQMVILTQGSRCNLDRHLPLIGLDEFFPRNMRITVDDHGYDRLKSNSEYPWLYAKWRAEHASGIRYDDSDIHVFEDSTDNLVPPHNMGWTTHYMHHGAPLKDMPAHIHRQEATATDFIQSLNAAPTKTGHAPSRHHENLDIG